MIDVKPKVYAYFYTDKHGNRRLDSFKPRIRYRVKQRKLVALGAAYRGSTRYAYKCYTNKQSLYFSLVGFRTNYECELARYGK